MNQKKEEISTLTRALCKNIEAHSERRKVYGIIKDLKQLYFHLDSQDDRAGIELNMMKFRLQARISPTKTRIGVLTKKQSQDYLNLFRKLDDFLSRSEKKKRQTQL